MSRVLVTGSTDGIGRATGRALLDGGHEVLFHARNADRATAVRDLAERGLGLVHGDLSSLREVRALAGHVGELGPLDAIVHNAGIYLTRGRAPTPDGHARTLAVNVLAPYLLTCLLELPPRVVWLSSGLHRSGSADLDDLDRRARRWDAGQAYADSKLLLTALGLAVARYRPDVASNVVDPGWVRSRMGGRGAPDSLEEGSATQVWLVTSDEPAARTGGGYWHRLRPEQPAPVTRDPAFQDAVIERLADLTGQPWPLR